MYIHHQVAIECDIHESSYSELVGALLGALSFAVRLGTIRPEVGLATRADGDEEWVQPLQGVI